MKERLRYLILKKWAIGILQFMEWLNWQNRLSEELSGSSICIDYGIDRDICCSIARIDKSFFPYDDLPETDAIIVTPYSSFESIKTILEEKVNCPIISLEEVIWSI